MPNIADPVRVHNDSNVEIEMSCYCLIEGLTRCFQALGDPECSNLLGPDRPGATLPGGARVPGTSYELEPGIAASNIDTMLRWSDSVVNFRHAFECFGRILANADIQSRQARTRAERPWLMRDVLTDMIATWEDQSEWAPDNTAAIIKDFEISVAPKLAPGQWKQLEPLTADCDKLAATAVDDFMALLVA